MAEFHYVPTGTGVISGREVLRQTEDAINNALEDGGDTREIAERAMANSETALQQSGKAVETANTAADTATQAQTTAGNALATANQANTTSQTALSTAQQASTTATNAVTAAQAAQTAAENAASDAADSEDIAAQALTSAQAAQTAAEAAQTAAETAQTDANQSAGIATQAQQAAAQSAQAAEQSAQSVAASARQIGEIITSTLPLSSAGLHLLDGALIDGSGIYADFVDYIAGLYTADPTAAYFTDEASWQSSATTYGVCGKFVYDSENDTVRLPKITGITEGTTDLTALGDLVEAGLPNITGVSKIRTVQDVETFLATLSPATSAIYAGSVETWTGNHTVIKDASLNPAYMQSLNLSAQRSNAIYGNSSTVQPQTIKTLVYIVIATVTKTEIQVDIDNIVTDLNSKVDISSPQTITGNKNFTGLLQHNGYSVDAVVASGAGYIRYDSGLQICWGKKLVTTNTAAGTGSYSYSGYSLVTFPVAFISTPSVQASANEYSAWWNASAMEASATTVRLTLANNTSGASIDVAYTAIGFWK